MKPGDLFGARFTAPSAFFDELPRASQLSYAEHAARQYLLRFRWEVFRGKRHRDDGVNAVATLLRSPEPSLFDLSRQQLVGVLSELDRGEAYREEFRWRLVRFGWEQLLLLISAAAIAGLSMLPGVSRLALLIIGAFTAIALSLALLALQERTRLARELRWEEHWYRLTLVRWLSQEDQDPRQHAGE